MSTDDKRHPWDGEIPEVVAEGGRWSKEVIGSAQYSTEWRGYTFEARCQLFYDDTWHMQVAAPSDPPEFAEQLIVDLLERDSPDPTMGRTMADAWGIDLADLDPADAGREIEGVG